MLPLTTTTVAALAGPAPVADLAERPLEFRDLHARIFVASSGRLRGTERITVRFVGEWNGIYRTIPVEYRTAQGLRCG